MRFGQEVKEKQPFSRPDDGEEVIEKVFGILWSGKV
jgi:hypothetical protein